jgi:hypothetical protein
MAEVTLEALGRLVERSLAEQTAMRAELREVRTLLAGVAERQRMLRDDIELMLKAELMGRFANFETQMERRLDELAERIAAAEMPGHGRPS